MKKFLPYILIAICVLLSAILMGNQYKYIILLMCIMGIYMISVSGLDILFGYSGQISLGHAAFYAIGAYGSTIISMKLGVPVIFSMFIGALIAALFATILGLFVSKLVHHFLALVTICFGEMVYLFVAQAPDNFTGGYSGINFIPKPQIGTLIFDTNEKYFFLIYVAVIVFLTVKQLIINSKIGRGFLAIRENPTAANGMGINVRRYKTMAFAISAFYTAFGGALYAHLIGYISPESFGSSQSVLFLTMVLFGGMGTFAGPLIGAVILTMISESLQEFGSYQMLFYGAFMLIVILFMSKGIAGSTKTILERLRERVKKHAESK